MLANVLIDQDVFKRVEDHVTTMYRDLRLPGLALAIVQDGQVIYQRGFGRADTSGRAVTPQTPFIIGSATKSFTALAIMQLVEAGKIDLDAPVQRYLPWFRVADLTASASITVRHLLSHTSGISRYVGRVQFASNGNATADQRVRELAAVDLTHPPGEVFQYSNSNYVVLGLLIQVVSGQSYQDYLQQHIFAPLHLGHTFTDEMEALRDGAATGYRWWFGYPFPANVPYPVDQLAAGYLYASAEDLARYLLMYMRDGRMDEGFILSEAGIAEMIRAQTRLVSRDGSYGLGWFIEDLQGNTLIRHGGEVANFRAEMAFLPEHRLGIVMLTNCNNGLVTQLGLDQVALGLIRLLLGLEPSKSRISFKQFYFALDATIVLLFALPCWSLASLLRGRHRSPQQNALNGIRLALPLAWETLLPLALFKRLPKMVDTPWPMLKRYVPDLSAWLSGAMGVLVATGVLRIMRILLASIGKERDS